MLTQIINAKILTPQGWLKDGSVLMRDDKILEVTNCDLAVIGAELLTPKGCTLCPAEWRSTATAVADATSWRERRMLSARLSTPT